MGMQKKVEGNGIVQEDADAKVPGTEETLTRIQTLKKRQIQVTHGLLILFFLWILYAVLPHEP